MAAQHDAGPVASSEKYEAVTVAIADDYLSQFSAVVRRIKKIGLQVESQLPTIGVVTGKIASDRMAVLSAAEGVAHVEHSWVYTNLKG